MKKTLILVLVAFSREKAYAQAYPQAKNKARGKRVSELRLFFERSLGEMPIIYNGIFWTFGLFGLVWAYGQGELDSSQVKSLYDAVAKMGTVKAYSVNSLLGSQ